MSFDSDAEHSLTQILMKSHQLMKQKLNVLVSRAGRRCDCPVKNYCSSHPCDICQ